MSTIRCFRTTGRFNLCDPSKESAQLVIAGLPAEAPSRTLRITVEIDGDHDTLTEDVWEMLEAIKAAEARCWINTSRKEMRDTMQWLEENRPRLEVEIARARAIRLQAVAAEAAQEAMRARAYLDEAIYEYEYAESQA